MDERSMLTLKSELDLFSVPPTQLAIDESSLLEVHPIATITDDISPIEFYIEGNGQNYLDFAHTFLHLTARIVKADGGELGDDDKVTTINYPLNSCFSQCSVFLNDKQVSSQVNYSYRSIIEALLFYDEASQSKLLSTGLFYKDTEGNFNTLDPTLTTNQKNLGLAKRYEKTKNSKLIDLLGPLHIDLANQDKLLINGVSVRIKLVREKDSFVLMSTTTGYKFQIKSARLLLRKVNVNPSVYIAHQKALDIGVIKLNLRKIEVKTFTLASGLQSTAIPNAFVGNLPTRVIISFVTNKSFNGSYDENPFFFKNFGINYICLQQENKMIPTKPYTPDFANDCYNRAYYGLFSELKSYYHNHLVNISSSEYKNGLTFFVFDLTPDYSASENHLSVMPSSNLSIELKFSQALPQTVNLLVYSEYRSLIEIDKSRAVYTDY